MIRLLRQALDGLNPSGKPPRLDRLETLAESVRASLRAGTALRATLHGTCVTLSRDAMLTIVPEPARRRSQAQKGLDGAGARKTRAESGTVSRLDLETS